MHELRDYQVEALQWLAKRRRSYLAGRPGSGKTAIALHHAYMMLYDSFEVERVLVVTPPRVVPQWAKEAKKYAATRDLRVQAYQGTPKQRKALLGAANRSDVVVCGHETMLEAFQEIENIGLVIYDEASRLRNGGRQGSVGWKVLNAVTRKRPKLQMLLMSGSPRPGRAHELYAPVFLIDRGAALGKTLTEFRTTWVEPDKVDRSTGQVFSYKLRPGMEQPMYKAIASYFLPISPDLGLKFVEIDRMVTLPPGVMTRYQALKKDKVLELDDFDVVVGSMGVLAGKLHQFAGGAVYDSDSLTGDWQTVHDAKLDELAQLVEELDGEPVLILAWYQHEFERIQVKLPTFERLETAEQVERARNGQIQLMGLHGLSANGLDGLQNHCSAVIWFSVPWSYEVYEQTNLRVVRSGQKETVRVFRILAEGTVDEQIAHEVLPTKKAEQDRFFQALEVSKNNVLA